MTGMDVRTLEPGTCAVRSILIPEFCFEHSRLLAHSPDLHRNDNDEDQQPRWSAQHKDIADDEHRTENVNGIADFGIDALLHKLPRLRRNRE